MSTITIFLIIEFSLLWIGECLICILNLSEFLRIKWGFRIGIWMILFGQFEKWCLNLIDCGISRHIQNLIKTCVLLRKSAESFIIFNHYLKYYPWFQIPFTIYLLIMHSYVSCPCNYPLANSPNTQEPFINSKMPSPYILLSSNVPLYSFQYYLSDI